MCGSADASGAVDGEPCVATVGENRLPRVEAHPHAHLATFGPRVRAEGTLRRCRGGDRVQTPHEDKEKRVSLGIDFAPPGGSECFAHDVLVLREDVGVDVASHASQQTGRPLDVGEEEGDRTGGQIRHAPPRADSPGCTPMTALGQGLETSAVRCGRYTLARPEPL